MDRWSLKIRYSRINVLKTLVTFARKKGEFLETKYFDTARYKIP